MTTDLDAFDALGSTGWRPSIERLLNCEMTGVDGHKVVFSAGATYVSLRRKQVTRYRFQPVESRSSKCIWAGQALPSRLAVFETQPAMPF